MGIFDGCILAADIDGTLIESGYINPKNIGKIEYFMSEGGYFSLATGRSIGAVSDVLSALKRVSPSVVANGCMIYDYENKKTVFDETIPNGDKYITKLVIESGLDIGIEIHCRETVLTINRNENTTKHQVYEKFSSADVDFETACKYSWNKVLFISPTLEVREKLAEYLKNEKTNCDFIFTCAVIDGETHNYYEQIPKSVSKASGLKKLCEIMGVSKERLFAIGDYYNDLPMLLSAGISAAPVGSPEDIKEKVDYVTVSCENGAVADFIDYLEARLNGHIR